MVCMQVLCACAGVRVRSVRSVRGTGACVQGQCKGLGKRIMALHGIDAGRGVRDLSAFVLCRVMWGDLTALSNYLYSQVARASRTDEPGKQSMSRSIYAL